jgi:hypothetical protein
LPLPPTPRRSDSRRAGESVDASATAWNAGIAMRGGRHTNAATAVRSAPSQHRSPQRRRSTSPVPRQPHHDSALPAGCPRSCRARRCQCLSSPLPPPGDSSCRRPSAPGGKGPRSR